MIGDDKDVLLYCGLSMIGDDEHSTCIFKAEATRMDFADSDFYILWLICKVCKSDV